MKNTNFDFADNSASTSFGVQQSDFYMLAMASLETYDDDDETDENDEEESFDENDPPIDEDVVHSPVHPQSGGKPK